MFVVAWFTPLFVAFDVFLKNIYMCVCLCCFCLFPLFFWLFVFCSVCFLFGCFIWFALVWRCVIIYLIWLCLSLGFFVFQTQRILVVVLCCFVVVVFACVVSGRPCSHCVLCLCFLLCFYGFLRLWTFNGIILRLLCSSWCYYDKIDLIGLFVCCFWYHESIDIIFEVLIISMD